ncbi:MAG: diacylglycerol kinase [Bacilli bacterium]|nr:diacylglycerol kinase [Bacilli bacterium]
MSKISRDDIKKKGIKRTLRTFKYSWQGLAYAYKNEQSMWVHAIGSAVTIILGIIFHLSLTEWAIVFIALGVILASELINTAIEAAVDLCTLEIHPLAKIAKDCGSAATFVLTIVSVIICLMVFVPHFIG